MNVTLPDETLIEYVHDPLGRRIAKKVDGTITEKYLWSGLTTLLAVYDGSDNLLMRFEYADGRMPVSMTKAGARYYFAYDQTGSLKAVANSSGTVVKTIQYDTFGYVLNDSDSSFTVPFGFAGGLHDRDTGLVRFGYRDYDPEIGRWTAKDPIFFNGGDTDLYGYVLNDPVNFIDPEGLMSILKKPTNPISDIGERALDGAEALGKGMLAAAKADYDQYKQLGFHRNDRFPDWEKYGDTFEEAYKNWSNEVMTGEKHNKDEDEEEIKCP